MKTTIKGRGVINKGTFQKKDSKETDWSQHKWHFCCERIRLDLKLQLIRIMKWRITISESTEENTEE